MTVQFHLNGPSLTIASLDYGDTLAQTSTELAERKNDLLNKPFSRFAIELFEFEHVRPLYLSTGNLRVSSPRPSCALPATPSSRLPQRCPSKSPSIPARSSIFRV